MSCLAVLAAAAVKWRSFGRIAERFAGAGGYWKIAAAFAREGAPLDAGRPPAYPLLLSGPAWLLAGDGGLVAAALLQALMAVAAVMLVWLVARRMAPAPGLALTAAALVAGNSSMLLEFLALRETLLYATMLLLGFAALTAEGGRPATRALAAGLFLAGAWLTRPTGFVPAGLFGLHFLWRFVRARKHPEAAALAAYTVGLAVPMGLWLAYQAASGQQPLRISGNRGAAPLYYSVHPAARLAYPALDIDRLDAVIIPEIAAEAGGTYPADPEPYLRKLLGRRLIDQQWWIYQQLPDKFLAFFLPLQVPYAEGEVRQTGEERYEVRITSTLSPIQRSLGIAALPGILAFFAALIVWRKLPAPLVLIAATVALTAAIHLISFAETRYRQPFDPLLAILAAGIWARRGPARQTTDPNPFP